MFYSFSTFNISNYIQFILNRDPSLFSNQSSTWESSFLSKLPAVFQLLVKCKLMHASYVLDLSRRKSPFSWWNVIMLKILNFETKYSWIMITLNSGIFTIFELSELNFNLNSSDCRARKIISNDTKLEAIP